MKEYRRTEVVSSKIRTITPQQAMKILERNQTNRKLSYSKVQDYARQYREDSWIVTHQGICLTESPDGDPLSGDLIDGQHRLTAIVVVRKSVRMLVTILRPVDDKGQLTAIGLPIDIGKKRSISDIINEEQHYVEVARTLIRDLIPLGNVRAQDPETVARVVDILHDSLQYVHGKCGSTSKHLSVAAVRSVIVLRHAQGYDFTEEYSTALRERYEKLPRSWVSWTNKLKDMGGPRNKDWRKLLFAYTWQLTSPEKNEEKAVMVRNIQAKVDEISEVFQDICLAAFVK